MDPGNARISAVQSASESVVKNLHKGFVFYDPYYEELLRRKRERDSSNHSHHMIAEADGAINELICARPNGKSPTEDKLLSHVRIPANHIHSELVMVDTNVDTPDGCCISPKSTVDQMERVMRYLYSELDRQKDLLTDSMNRESRAMRELLQLRKKVKSENRSEYVPSEEFRALESKYINALKLVDELNWRLNSLPSKTT
jgi:hypothetical protein